MMKHHCLDNCSICIAKQHTDAVYIIMCTCHNYITYINVSDWTHISCSSDAALGLVQDTSAHLLRHKRLLRITGSYSHTPVCVCVRVGGLVCVCVCVCVGRAMQGVILVCEAVGRAMQGGHTCV